VDESFPGVDDGFVRAGMVVLPGALESDALAREEWAAFAEGVVAFYVRHFVLFMVVWFCCSLVPVRVCCS
jgi:hypothetical protein